MRDCSLSIIFNPDRSEILLLQRKDVPIWVLPGGGIDPGERPEEAAIREVYEETGLVVSIARLAAEYSPINRFTTKAHLFECRIDSGTLLVGDEARRVAFFPLKALPAHLFHYHREWLNDVLGKETVIRQPMSRSTFRSIILYYLCHPHWGLRYLFTRLTLRCQSLIYG